MKLISALLLLLFSCSDPAPQSERRPTTILSGVSMTMPYRLLIGELLTPEQESEAGCILADCFDETDRLYNKYNPDSELSHLNNLRAGQPAPLSPQLERLLAETNELVKLTGGRFDPTIEPLQALWREKLEAGEQPSEDEIALVASAVGWHHIHFSDGIFSKDHDLTQLDLGGIAKGLCVDRVVNRFKDAGYPNVYFEWGGEIATAGQHPEGRPWTVFISALGSSDPTKALDTLELEDEGLATSGDYMQYWVGNEGTTYFHIIDPRTLSPLIRTNESIASVSILAPSCQLADALATAAMIFNDVDEARQWTESLKAKIPHLEAWVVSRKELSDES